MMLRRLKREDYPLALSLFEKLDELHILARPDCFAVRDDVFPKQAYDAWMDDPDGFFMGAFDGEIMAGLVRATLWHESGMIKNVNTVCLDDIYVLPGYRRHGLAAKFFAAVESWARENAAVRLELHVWDFNHDALSLYRAMGMHPQRYVLEKEL